jgi:gliding motility-associated-like protein
VQVFATDGVASIKVIATNSSGCADTLVKQITVHALPAVNAGIDTFVCRGKGIQLQPAGAVSYTWVGSGLSCTNCPNPNVSPANDAWYAVTGKDAHNCQAADTVWVKVQQHLPMKIDKGDTLCLGQSTVKTLSGTEKYTWSPALFVDNPNAAQVTIRPAKDTLMVYKVVGQDNRGCFADTGYIKIKTFPIPKMEPLQSEISVNAGTSFKLESNISKDVTKVKWSPAKWLDNADSKRPTAIGKESITYTVVASNDGACVTRNEVKITVLCNGANFFIPNTFSPNADGMNDVFYPRGKGVFTVKSFRIFNRWGEVVFERVHFNPNDQNFGWDGTFKGQKLPADVYMYAIEVQCDNSTIVPAKGNVTLLR